MNLLMHPEAGSDKKFFNFINRANQILIIDAAQEEYNIFGFDEAENLWTTNTDK